MGDCLVCLAMSGQSVCNICKHNFVFRIIATVGIMLPAMEHMCIVNHIGRQFFSCTNSVVWWHLGLDCYPLSRLVVLFRVLPVALPLSNRLCTT